LRGGGVTQIWYSLVFFLGPIELYVEHGRQATPFTRKGSLIKHVQGGINYSRIWRGVQFLGRRGIFAFVFSFHVEGRQTAKLSGIKVTMNLLLHSNPSVLPAAWFSREMSVVHAVRPIPTPDNPPV
jgi:hypothetical protein